MSRGLLDIKVTARQSELGSEFIGRLVPHCTAVLNTDGQVIYFSPSWFDYTGTTESQSLGIGWLTVIHPEDAAVTSQAWAGVTQNGIGHWTYEARSKMHDGMYRWFLVRAQRYKDEEGVVRRWYASMLDVHESTLQKLETERNRKSILTLHSNADASLWGANQNHEIYIREGALSWIPTSVPPFQQDEQDTAKPARNIVDGKSSLATLEHQMDGRWYHTRFVADLNNIVHDVDSRPIVQAALGLTMNITDVRARATLQVRNEKLVVDERAASEEAIGERRPSSGVIVFLAPRYYASSPSTEQDQGFCIVA